MKLEDFTPCLVCGEQVGKANAIMFYQVTLQRMAFDHAAIQTTAGLSLQLRSPALVNAFNPTPELAKPLGDPEKFLLCDACAMRPYPVMAMEERAVDRHCTDDTDGAPTLSGSPDDGPTPGEAA